MGADLAATQVLLELEHGHPHNSLQVQLELPHQECATTRHSAAVRILSAAGLAWEWMEDWLKVQEGKSGGQMPKQYRLGQFKGGG